MKLAIALLASMLAALDIMVMPALVVAPILLAQTPTNPSAPAPNFDDGATFYRTVPTTWTGPVGVVSVLTFCVDVGGNQWSAAIGLHGQTGSSDHGSASGSSGTAGSPSTIQLPPGVGVGTLEIFQLGSMVYLRLTILPTMPWTGELTGVVTIGSHGEPQTQVPVGVTVAFQ